MRAGRRARRRPAAGGRVLLVRDDAEGVDDGRLVRLDVTGVGGEDRLLVLHAFQKKTERTTRADLDLARKRLRDYRRPA